MLNEREIGKMAVTRILSGVDDITINGSNKNRTSKKEEMDLVSFLIMLLPCCHFLKYLKLSTKEEWGGDLNEPLQLSIAFACFTV